MRIAFHLNCAIEINGQKILSKVSWRRISARVQARDNYACFYCGAFDEKGHVDHIIPLSRGGTDNLENLVWSCVSCNTSKGDMTLQEWRSKQETDRQEAQRLMIAADLSSERQKQQEQERVLFDPETVRKTWEAMPKERRNKSGLCVALGGVAGGGHFYKVDAVGRELGLWE